MNAKYDGKSGRKNEWILLLQRHEPEHHYGLRADISVLSGKTLLEVCSSPPALGLVSEDM